MDGWIDGWTDEQTKVPLCSTGLNSRKSVRWSAVPVPCLGRLCLKLREGAIEIWVFRRRFRLEGWDLGLVADFEPRGLD